MVKTPCFHAGATGSIPGKETKLSHVEKKKFLSLRGREFALSAWVRSEEM